MEHYLGNDLCDCGRFHTADIDDVIIGKGVIRKLPEILGRYDAKKPFILCDANTFAAAGEAVCKVLDSAAISYSCYSFPAGHLPPNEKTVGSAILHFDNSCDMVVAVGSGVINDTGKILAATSKLPYIIVGTAPSMDGYASATSSMDRDDLKASLNRRCANVIIGDVDILKNAPAHMLAAGLGDMLAKYVSIAEWRIAHIITGEYYCEKVAQLVRTALKKCADNAEGLLNRDETAVAAVSLWLMPVFPGLLPVWSITSAMCGTCAVCNLTPRQISTVFSAPSALTFPQSFMRCSRLSLLTRRRLPPMWKLSPMRIGRLP